MEESSRRIYIARRRHRVEQIGASVRTSCGRAVIDAIVASASRRATRGQGIDPSSMPVPGGYPRQPTRIVHMSIGNQTLVWSSARSPPGSTSWILDRDNSQLSHSSLRSIWKSHRGRNGRTPYQIIRRTSLPSCAYRQFHRWANVCTYTFNTAPDYLGSRETVVVRTALNGLQGRSLSVASHSRLRFEQFTLPPFISEDRLGSEPAVRRHLDCASMVTQWPQVDIRPCVTQTLFFLAAACRANPRGIGLMTESFASSCSRLLHA